MNVCYGYIKDRDDAEDITQDIFLEVFKTIKNFKEESSLFTWIYRIAISKSLDEIKKRKSLKRSAFFEKRVRSDASDLEMQNTTAEEPEPDDELILKQQKQFIEYCIHKLADTQRTAFILSQQQGLSYKEIAEIMDKSLSSIESLVHRSKMNLRKIMETDYKNFF